MSAKTIKLSDLLHVRSRFGRSVNLERDFYEQSSVDGYILTSTARSTLQRIAQSLTDASGARAWTLTGPYGSGKSAFALFAAKALGCEQSESPEAARAVIKAEDEALWQMLFDRRRRSALAYRGFCPVLVSGSREPIQKALLVALERAIKHFWPGNPPLLLEEVRALLSAIEAGETLPGRRVVEAFEQAAQKACSSRNPGDGLLIVIDELGKLFEYAAAQSDRSDIFVLQELAEAAKRSKDHPILLVTILHQSFDRYFGRLGHAQREEWMKVQGRFEDVAFQEPIEQVLKVTARAIAHHGPSRAVQALKRHGRQLAQEAAELQLAPGWMKKQDALELLGGCAPLHPTVALAIGHVFRQLAQNERSLFAFLTSQEPFGFQEFLANTGWDEQRPATLRADHLYDYIVTALGSGLYAHGNGRAWAEIESALNRLADPTELEARLIKTIGLLNAIGDIGYLKPSKQLLRFALADEKIKAKDIDRALDNLQKRSVVIYRKYRDAFSLWEGSDIDVDARLAEARTRVDASEPLAHSLSNYFKPKPIVARRHSFQTGTLRFFEVRYTGLSEFESALNKPSGDADGLIIYAIASNRDEAAVLAEKARSLTMRDCPQVLIAIPQEMSGLQESIFEVACLKWILKNTPEMEGDLAARKEIQARLANAESSVEKLLRSSLIESPALTKSAGRGGCAWYRNGKQIEIHSERALQEYLSLACDEVFSEAPVLHNEMINRRRISSSAAAARRELISAMLSHSYKEVLGIEGFPPQLSIYYSLFEATGMHREENGRWGFHPPKADADSGTIATWKAISDFFAETEVKRLSVAELFDLLARPPHGIKSGPLPVLLCAALMHYDTEIAVYEQGSFIPSLSLDVFERLMKSPERFDVQRCRIAGVRAAVFERFANVLLQKPERALAEKPNLLAIVRPLTKFAASLPVFTRSTKRLSQTTLQVRDALFASREPDRLLFSQLPEACGFEPFLSDDSRESPEIDDFFKSLRASLSELQRAYDDLLGEIESLLIAAFSLRSRGEDARREIIMRAQPLIDLTVEPKLKSFIIRAIDEGLDLAGWIESIATFLSSKPPTSWNDTDLARFEISLAEVARSFLHIELLSFELNKRGATNRSGIEVIRLGITSINEPEHEKVLTINKQEQTLIEAAEHSVEQALESAGLNGNLELRLTVLARLSRKTLELLEKSNKQKAHAARPKAHEAKRD